jgi:RNA polymerase sigma-70 factor (ECF subfamily)
MDSLVNEPMAERENSDPAAAGLPPSGFADLYAEHSRAIYYLALRFLGDPQKAEDATHDVFLKAFRKLDQFRGEAAPRTWLYRIAIYHCRTDSPLRVLEIKELGERIRKTMDALPAEYRLLLLLVADQDLSYDQVAALTGQSADAVRGKLHRARKAFGALFAKTDQVRYESQNQTHADGTATSFRSPVAKARGA